MHWFLWKIFHEFLQKCFHSFPHKLHPRSYKKSSKISQEIRPWVSSGTQVLSWILSILFTKIISENLPRMPSGIPLGIPLFFLNRVHHPKIRSEIPIAIRSENIQRIRKLLSQISSRDFLRIFHWILHRYSINNSFHWKSLQDFLGTHP